MLFDFEKRLKSGVIGGTPKSPAHENACVSF
jgi:hypothetical protein